MLEKLGGSLAAREIERQAIESVTRVPELHMQFMAPVAKAVVQQRVKPALMAIEPRIPALLSLQSWKHHAAAPRITTSLEDQPKLDGGYPPGEGEGGARVGGRLTAIVESGENSGKKGKMGARK